jgi:hypothetical protein
MKGGADRGKLAAGAVLLLLVASPNLLLFSVQLPPPVPSISTWTSAHTRYVKNPYYIVGIGTENGVLNFTKIRTGSNASVARNPETDKVGGLLTPELNANVGGGAYSPSNATVTVLSQTADYVAVGFSAAIGSRLKVTYNMTFFANAPDFVASINDTVAQAGTNIQDDIYGTFNSTWNTATAAPDPNGRVEVCSTLSCPVKPYNAFASAAVVFSRAFNSTGPVWYWAGNSTSPSKGEGVGYLLLSYSTSGPQKGSSHYFTAASGHEVGFNFYGSEPPSGDAPFAPDYGVAKNYAAFDIYINAVPYKAFEDWALSRWRATQAAHTVVSSLPYAAFAGGGLGTTSRPWSVVNPATIVTGCRAAIDCVFYVGGTNSSEGQSFPFRIGALKVNATATARLALDFAAPTVTTLSNDGTTAMEQVVYDSAGDRIRLAATVATKGNSDKVNVTGYFEVINAPTSMRQLYFAVTAYDNYYEGGAPSAYEKIQTANTTAPSLSWNYTRSGFGILLNPGNGFAGELSSPNSGQMFLFDRTKDATYPVGTRFDFAFTVYAYSPLSNGGKQYTKTIVATTYRSWAVFPGNATRVAFSEDSSRIFSYLARATEFASNGTIARMAFSRAFGGRMQFYYSGPVNGSCHLRFSNGTTVSAARPGLYDPSTKLFSIDVSSAKASWVGLYLGNSGTGLRPGGSENLALLAAGAAAIGLVVAVALVIQRRRRA